MRPRFVDHVQRWVPALAVLMTIAGIAGADETLEEIVVTGSRIARRDFESASPIVSVARERFEQTGSSTVESTINTLPQFVPSVTSTSNNPANGGQANVSLRGLGGHETLVLLDGRRLMPANGNGVADLNIVPPSLIESVEVITGGASAVYGSDAMSGVVNFKLRKNFEGVEIDGHWGQTDHSDGAEYAGTLTAGTDFAGGRGNVAAAVNYAKRDMVTGADREFTRYALQWFGPGLGTPGLPPGFRAKGSDFIEEGRAEAVAASAKAFEELFSSYGYSMCNDDGNPPGCVPYQSNLSVNADGTLFTTGNRSPGSVANFRGQIDPLQYNDARYTYNFAPGNALRLPLERKGAYARATFQFDEATEAYLQGLYADYDVSLMLAPTPALDLYMPPTNPYIPPDLQRLLDSRLHPEAPVRFSKRLSELGPRLENLTYDVYQVTAGLKGWVFGGWQYDAYAQWGANEQTDRQTNNALTSRIEELTYATDGGQSICGGFDPFGIGSISPGCAEYIAVDGVNHSEVNQALAEASLSGALFSLLAGDVRVVVGLFYKRDKYQYTADPAVSRFITSPGNDCEFPEDPCRSDILGFNPSDDISGDDANFDVYVEALVPLLSDLPGARRLEAVVGYRHSDYQSIGGAEAYKAELLWKPVEVVTLRGSYERAIRAPSVVELYLPQLPSQYSVGSELFFDIQDPCAYDSEQRSGANRASVEALCLEQGVPAALLPEFQDADQMANGFAGGNPDLGSERAKTVTLGVVLDSHAESVWLRYLQASIDWYRIEIDNGIWQIGANGAIALCYDAVVNPAFSPDNRWCNAFQRSPETGELRGVYDINQNTGRSETSGIDLQTDWRLDAGPGQFSLNWLVSYVANVDFGVADGIPPDQVAGTIGSAGFEGSLPEWKWSLNAGYAWPNLALNGRWRHIAGVDDYNVPEFHVPAYDYFDVDLNYDITAGGLQGLSLGLGIENVGDKDPPVFPSLIQSNTDPAQYDVLGRRYYVAVKYAF